MKKRLIIAVRLAALSFAICHLSFSPAGAQTLGGELSANMLKDIQKEYKQLTTNKALSNAMAFNSIDNLTKNYQNAGAIDTYFSVETKKQSITDQQSTLRQWSSRRLTCSSGTSWRRPI